MKTRMHNSAPALHFAALTTRLLLAVAVKYTSKWSSADEQLNMHNHKGIKVYREGNFGGK